MLRMSKLADYAFIILTQMSGDILHTWSAASLSQSTTLPLPTVAKLMKLLAKSGIVKPQRGASGGYVLSRPPFEISIADIIEAVDGPISLTECAGMAVGKTVCDCAVAVCPIKQSWTRVNTAIRRSLEIVYLSDLAPSEEAA